MRRTAAHARGRGVSQTAVLVVGTLAGSLVVGISGFAFALTASVIWLR